MEEQFKAHLRQHVKTEVNVKKNQEIEHVLKGTIRPQTGHFVWEINEETGVIKKAEFKRTTAVFGASVPSEELIVKANCVYIPALNKGNAKKRYLKNKEQSFYYMKEPAMKISECFIT